MRNKFSSILVVLLFTLLAVSVTTTAHAKTVVLKTNLGEIHIALNEKKAPVSCANFLKYVADGFYDGLIFHRVIPNFMIQGGGFAPGMARKQPMAPIKNEAGNGLKNKRGTIAMARTNVIDSATSQFFINLKDNNFLDHAGRSPQRYGYAVFGEVIQGMDVVDHIARIPTGRNGMYRDVPIRDIVILEAYEK